MIDFEPFDPLKYKSTAETEVAARALKREIREILGSYVGWYDPFAELIQNSLDSIETRKTNEGKDYEPSIWVTVDIQSQKLTVTDNGVGLNKQQFNQFLVPFFSFKSQDGKTRGHKGVGATYLGYGFNYIQVCTKSDGFSTIGKMLNSRKWLTDENPSGNPEVIHDSSPPEDSNFKNVDKGVSITLQFDSTTHPRDLKWIGTSSAKSWFNILRIKTGIGSYEKHNDIKVYLKVIGKNGKSDEILNEGTGYLWIQDLPGVKRSISIKDLDKKVSNFFEKKGIGSKLPSSLKNFDCIYEKWSSDELMDLIKIDEDEKRIIELYTPKIYCGYTYTAKLFSSFNESLNLREGYKIFSGGFQISANDMPQGEIYQIPLQRYQGRQNQVHFLINFENCSADLGRKGFHKDIVDFCKSISEKIVSNYLNKFKSSMRPNSGAPTDIKRKKKVDDWKELIKNHEKDHPLQLTHDNFFLPTKKISLTSEPTREQDVIALFNQLIAGGVIRGVSIMSTNERFTYDGLYRIKIEEPTEHHIYDRDNNPLGILEDNIDSDDLPFASHPDILEYKFSLDGLMEDISDGTKNSNDIGLVVAWETGSQYMDNFHITSILDEDNLSERQYHGVTHSMTNLQTEQKEMDLIVLSELIQLLNDYDQAQLDQKSKYDEY
nr:ATP-binding protein [uncultured Allomuricauda sp.]